MNKKNILRASLASFALASAIGLGVALFASSPETAMRATTCASILGVLGISSFFVGLAYPKE